MSLTYANIFANERREVSDPNEALALSKMQLDRGDGILVRPWGILIPGSDWQISDVQPPSGGQAGAQNVDTSGWTLDNLIFNGKPLRAWFGVEVPLESQFHVSPGFQSDPNATPVSLFTQAVARQSATAIPIAEAEEEELIRKEGLQNIPLILLAGAAIFFLLPRKRA